MWRILPAACLFGWLATTAPLAAGEALVVVELFTSQGCSSCVPADALAAELARRPDLLVLSEHVDYWDYLGWKDPFALPAAVQRQRQYAKLFGLSYVYTPQIVVGGTSQAAGNDRAAVVRLIERSSSEPRADVAVIANDGPPDSIRLSTLAGHTVDRPADVWLICYDREHKTQIAEGENKGRSVRNVNVVRHIDRIGTWRGEPIRFSFSDNCRSSGRHCAVLVQTAETGQIIGAARCSP